MQNRTGLPPGVTATRMITFVQGVLGGLTGLLLLFGGPTAATANGLKGAGAGAVFAFVGAVILASSGLLIWGGVMLGRLSAGARMGVLIYEWLSVFLGVMGLTHPGLGLLGLLLAGVAVYYLQFDARTKAAFGVGTGVLPVRPTQEYPSSPQSG